jgi:flavin reductase (DIM6/NTAB) family NADH-FMN oxidoreductase RutF
LGLKERASMAKASIGKAGRYSYHYPQLAVIVTTHARGKDNAMTVAWHASISVEPPLYGLSISPRRYTYELILEAKEFGINFMPFEAAELLASVGGSKGIEVDKFERFHIAKEKPLKTAVPVLADAYACYECKLVDHKTYGDHEWMVGEIVATHFSEEAFAAEGTLDITRINPALYLGAENYLTTLKDSIRHLDRQTYGRR